ncbi:hypothetical protein ABIB40_001080 [Pedobacter sp. UYP30]|uniref:hypothetical protein n=1 Tax=Pedobacter sp. UYP30 TaxID=1756400 RepID=UPI00339668DD
MKIISAKTHAVLDFVTVIALLAVPDLVSLSPHAAVLSYALAGIHFLMTVMTDFSGGILKIIPFKIHGYVELLVGIALVILAFTFFKGNKADEIYFACFGIIILIVFCTTDYHKKLPTIL